MPWSEDQLKAAGLHQVKVRIRRASIDRLDEVGEMMGENRGETIARLIEAEWREVCGSQMTKPPPR